MYFLLDHLTELQGDTVADVETSFKCLFARRVVPYLNERFMTDSCNL